MRTEERIGDRIKIGDVIDRFLTNPGIEMKHALCKCGAVSKQEHPLGYHYICPACARKAAREKRAAWAENNIYDALARAGVPEEYRHQSFDNYIPFPELTKQIKVCKDYVLQPAGSLFLTGDNDNGKSHLGMAILRELTLQGYETRYINVPELIFNIRSSFDGRTVRNEQWFVERGSLPEFVFLDDLGAEGKISEWSESIIYLILNRRIGKLTVTTSNLNLDRVETRFSGRISTRLVREGVAIDFHAPRFRLRDKKEIKKYLKPC